MSPLIQARWRTDVQFPAHRTLTAARPRPSYALVAQWWVGRGMAA